MQQRLCKAWREVQQQRLGHCGRHQKNTWENCSRTCHHCTWHYHRATPIYVEPPRRRRPPCMPRSPPLRRSHAHSAWPSDCRSPPRSHDTALHVQHFAIISKHTCMYVYKKTRTRPPFRELPIRHYWRPAVAGGRHASVAGRSPRLITRCLRLRGTPPRRGPRS